MKKMKAVGISKFIRLSIALLFVSWLAPPVSAQTAQVVSGLTWLKSNQHGDGSWGTLNSFRDTSTVADTYRLLGQTDSSYQNALTWVNGFTLESNDFLARKIAALLGSGSDISSDIQRLVSYQNPDGGWGYYPGYASAVYDTAVVSSILNTANLQNKAVLSNAVNYLISKQNTEGYWSILPDSTGDVTTTSLIVNVLSTSGPSTALNKAVSWLRSKQNPDGGFGSSPSTIHDTAFALLALSSAGQIQAQQFQNGIDYLASNQLGDGSWRTSPYETAAAMKALDALRSNLSITASEVTVSDSTPKSGDVVAIQAVIKNTGTSGARNVPVQVSAEGPDHQVILVGAEQIIPVLPIGGTFPISVNFDTAGKVGTYALAITIDPVNTISETSKTDNQASTGLTIRPLISDLTAGVSDVVLSNSSPKSGDAVTITAVIRNIGTAVALDVPVVMVAESSAHAVIPLGSAQVIPSIEAGGSATISTVFDTTGKEGAFTISVEIDPDNIIAELLETNNRVDLPLTVAPVKPDLTISPAELSISNKVPLSGEQISIHAVTRNIGNAAGSNIPVQIVAEGPDAQLITLASQIIAGMAPGASFAVDAVFDTKGKSGAYTISVSIDPDNAISELSETNNRTSATVNVMPAADFAIENNDVTLSSPSVNIGEDVTVTARVSNVGNKAANDVEIEYYYETISPGTIIGSSYIPYLAPGEAVSRQATWKSNKVGPSIKVLAVADPQNKIADPTRTNNSGFASLEVKAVTEPNLTVSYKDIIFTPAVADARKAVDVSAVVRNEGFSTTGAFDVECYNGDPRSGGVSFDKKTMQPLAPGASAPVTCSWPDIPLPGEQLIFIKADSGEAAQEFNENDNYAFAILNVRSLPELTISESSISFSPALPKEGDKVIITAAVQNLGQQPASNVLVKATRDGLVIGTQTLESLDGMLRTGMTLTFETTGKQGSNLITLAVDPDDTIVEQNEYNNVAEKTLMVQNADLWVTEAYFSPNGDGVKDTTELIFRLKMPGTVTVNVVNAKSGIVKSFSGDTLANITDGNIVWDGLSENGSVVDDGEYELQVADRLSKTLIGSVRVAVDTNRSPLTDALGTKYLLKNNMSCMLPEINEYDWQWLPNESGVVFNVQHFDEDAPEYTTGLYAMAPDGQDVQRLIPSDWTADNVDYRYSGYEFRLSADSEKIAFIFWKYDRQKNESWTELWLVDADGRNLRLLEKSDASGYIEGLKWSADHRHIAYTIRKYDGYNDQGRDFWIADITTGNKIKIDSEYPYSYYPSYEWSPDGKELAYLVSLNPSPWYFNHELRKTDVSGNKSSIFVFSDDADIDGREIVYWLYNRKVVIQQNDGTWLYDMSGNGNHKQISDIYPYEQIVLQPDKKGFSFYEYAGNRVYVKIADEEGITATVYEAPLKWGEAPFPALRNMIWSGDSKKLAFIDSAYKALDGCLYESYVIVVDAGTKNRKASKVADAQCNEAALSCSWENYDLCLNKTPRTMHVDGIVSWFPDTRHLLLQSSDGTYSQFEYPVMNSESGELKQSLPIAGSWNSTPTLSPIGRYITYYETVDQSSACFGRGERDFWSISSLLNLTADLRAIKSRSAILLKGIAADLNFESYQLAYADIKSPDVWTPVQPPSTMPVANETFTVWVPPYEGTFLVKLTAWDKAGNAAVDRKRVSWGQASIITNLYKTTDFISPNGDGTRDDVELHYRVLEPVNLEFTIYDPDDRPVTAYTKAYTVPASDFIKWDGRDESGTVVPDGKYKIKVFDYEFFVEVDNDPPHINISLSGIGSEWVILSFFGGGGGGFSVPILQYFSKMEGHAIDKNLMSWTAEYRKSDGPDWSEYKHGTDTLAKRDDDGNLMLDPVKDAEIDRIADGRLELLVGKEVRMRAEDFAGNESIVFSGLLEERLILNKWDNKFVEGVIPNDKRRPGLHIIQGLETIRLPLTSVTVQYYYKGQWTDAPSALKDPASGMLTLEWNNSFMLPRDGYYVRLIGINSLGYAYYSNIITTEQFDILTECDQHQVTAPDMPAVKTPLNAVNTVSDDLHELKLQVAPTEFGPWTDYRIFDASKGDVIPKGQFYPVLPPTEPGKAYYIRMVGVVLSSDGRKQDKYETGPTPYPVSCTSVGVSVTYKEKEDCGALADTAEILASIKNFKANIALTNLSLYVKYTDEFQLLRAFDLAKGQNIVPVPIQTSSITEGMHPVKAILTYVDLDDKLMKEVFATAYLIVDRVLPDAEINYPDQKQMVCPVHASTHGENWLVVPVEGIAIDNTAVRKYELHYGVGEDPAEWKPATSKTYDSEMNKLVDVPITGPGTKGLLGKWAVSGFSYTGYSLKLKVIDFAGNVSCTTTNFSLDATTEITYLQADKKIFSPNNDGVQDDVTVFFPESCTKT